MSDFEFPPHRPKSSDAERSSEPFSQHAAQMQRALHAAASGLVEREVLVELVALAAVAREHVLVIGPPGTAKSEAARRIAAVFGGRCFEYQLNRFTEPNELFGPIDLQKLREGRVETRIEGMLPDAHVAFLDEVFQGSSAILNTLLGLLNEGRFRRGHTDVAVPLRICVAASNDLPDDPALTALADRFLIRVFVEPVSDAQLEALLESGPTTPELATACIGLEPVDVLAQRAHDCDLSGARPLLAEAIRQLRSAGIELTDRRLVKAQRLIGAAATLAGRTRAEDADLWPLVYVVPTAENQTTAREVLNDLLKDTRNPTLQAAAVDASAGLKAREDRLRASAEELISRFEQCEEEAASGLRLRLEGVLREIDAAFAPSQRSEAMNALRERLVGLVSRP